MLSAESDIVPRTEINQKTGTSVINKPQVRALKMLILCSNILVNSLLLTTQSLYFYRNIHILYNLPPIFIPKYLMQYLKKCISVRLDTQLSNIDHPSNTSV